MPDEKPETNTGSDPRGYGGVNFENLRRMLKKLQKEHYDQIDRALEYMDRIEKAAKTRTIRVKEDTQFNETLDYQLLKEMTVNGETFTSGQILNLPTKYVADNNLIALGFVKRAD